VAVRIDDVVDAYRRELAVRRGLSARTVAAYAAEARSLLAFLADLAGQDASEPIDVAHLELADVRAWLAARQRAGHARASIARHSSSIRTFCTWLCREGYADADAALVSAAARQEGIAGPQ